MRALGVVIVSLRKSKAEGEDEVHALMGVEEPLVRCWASASIFWAGMPEDMVVDVVWMEC